jgi:nucleoid-associated protein YgaU
MGLFSFAKSAGRKIGLFGGQAAAKAEEAKQQMQAAQEAIAAATEEAERKSLERRAVEADIQGAILSHGISVAGLTVVYDGDKVTLTGTAPSQADAEKAVLIAGNTEGIEAVDDQIEVEVPAPAAVHHTVVRGDSLSKISLANYGTMQAYEVIFEANKPMLEHPDRIYPDQVLRIPVLAGLTHTVKPGQSLGAIAKFHYGKSGRYTEIFEANKDILDSADAVEVGQVIAIPLSGPAVDPRGEHV